MNASAFDYYVFQVRVQSLNIKLIEYILFDVDAFIADPTPLTECFCNRYETCVPEITRICVNLRKLIEREGEEGLREFRDDLQAELNRPVSFISTVN